MFIETLVFVPVAVLFIEVSFAITRRERVVRTLETYPRGRLAVLIPAHNEAAIIAATLAAIRPQLFADDRVLVVADNCSDDTALVAATGGAEVASRTDVLRRGKGFALDFGVKRLAKDPPDTVIIIDADCQPQLHCIDRLARACTQVKRPIQARYLMHAQPLAGPKMKIAEFAWLVKNRVRPMGLGRFHFPAHLTGSGMAFPWPQIRDADLASGHIVEDLKLGIDLACAGTAVLYCDAASIDSYFPFTAEDSSTQRTRWEHGHLHVILTEAPRMIGMAIRKRDFGLFVLALDLCVPPLVLLIFVVLFECVLTAVVFVSSRHTVPLEIASLTLGVLLVTILSAWLRFGRTILSITDLAAGFGYALMKIPVYGKFLIARQVTWIRAKRD